MRFYFCRFVYYNGCSAVNQEERGNVIPSVGNASGGQYERHVAGVFRIRH